MKTAITILVSIFYVSFSFGQDGMKEIKITKEWKINPSATLDLTANKQSYKVEFWDKDIVRIDFTISSNKSNFTTSDFEEMLNISSNNSTNNLKITTSLNTDKSSSIWDWLVKAKDKITNQNKYNEKNIIYLPRNLTQLNLQFDYSILSIGEINMPLKISSNYSEISILKNSNRTIINSSYTDMKLGNLSNLKINSTYGDFIIDNIDTLFSNYSYCDIKLANCAYLQSLNINYGDIEVQNAGYIKATLTYSDIKIKTLQQELNAVLTYSDLDISNISKNVYGINITAVHSDTKLKINPEYPINIQIKDVDGDIDIKNPRMQLIISKSETGNTTNITANTKSATDASPTIKINSKLSDIIIY